VVFYEKINFTSFFAVHSFILYTIETKSFKRLALMLLLTNTNI